MKMKSTEVPKRTEALLNAYKNEEEVKTVLDPTQETIQMTTVCGLVLKMGDLCYHDKDKFPKGPWCKLNEWIIFSRYAGSRFKIDGGEVRVLNDDEVISTISNPADILHHY